MILEADGFSVIGEAEDGASALTAIESLHPDLVLLDIQLPDMDGFDVLDQLGADGTAGRPRVEPGRVRLRRPDPKEPRARLHPQGRAVRHHPSLAAPVTRRRLAAAVALGGDPLRRRALPRPPRRPRRPANAGLHGHRRGPDLHRHRRDRRDAPPGQPHRRRRCSPSVSSGRSGRSRPRAARLAFTIGYVLSGVAFVPFTLLILAYPTGRLRPEDRWFVPASAAIVVLGPLAIALFDPTPIPDCTDCPENLLADHGQHRARRRRRPSRTPSSPPRSAAR